MFFRALFSILLVYSTTCFSSDFFESQNALIDEIVAHGECVAHVTEDKAYIKPENIIPTEQGIFVDLGNDHYVPIPTLFSDAEGCYVLTLSPKATKPCPFCGWERLSGIFKCRNPDCPSNRPKK